MVILKNIISIDVEQWYDRPVLKQHITNNDINPNNIFNSIKYILDILNKYNKRTTFFILGEVAEFAPGLVERIYDAGHEIAYHGYSHTNLSKIGLNDFKTQIHDGINLIGHITKEKVCGFRSPIFSLNQENVWALEVLSNNGFIYDSSVFPVKTPLYGSNYAPIHPYYPSFRDPFIEDDAQNKIIEFPILVRTLFSKRVPAGGGFYLRSMGVNFVINSIKLLNKKGYPAMCYLHPWEIFGFPKLNLPFYKKIYSYYGVPCSKSFEKLVRSINIVPAQEIVDDIGGC